MRIGPTKVASGQKDINTKAEVGEILPQPVMNKQIGPIRVPAGQKDINTKAEVVPQPVVNKQKLRAASKDVRVNQTIDSKRSQYMLDIYNSTELLSFDEE